MVHLKQFRKYLRGCIRVKEDKDEFSYFVDWQRREHGLAGEFRIIQKDADPREIANHLASMRGFPPHWWPVGALPLYGTMGE